jgi:hypothetical protein
VILLLVIILLCKDKVNLVEILLDIVRSMKVEITQDSLLDSLIMDLPETVEETVKEETQDPKKLTWRILLWEMMLLTQRLDLRLDQNSL